MSSVILSSFPNPATSRQKKEKSQTRMTTTANLTMFLSTLTNRNISEEIHRRNKRKKRIVIVHKKRQLLTISKQEQYEHQ